MNLTNKAKRQSLLHQKSQQMHNSQLKMANLLSTDSSKASQSFTDMQYHFLEKSSMSSMLQNMSTSRVICRPDLARVHLPVSSSPALR
jgi:hypothetical protein